MTKLLFTAFALGLASLDLTGALAAVGALGAGARVRALIAFGVFSILGTIAFGSALSLIIGPRIAGFDWGMLLPHDPTENRVAAAVNVVVGLGLLAWGIMRTRRPATRPPKPSVPRGFGLISLAGAGMLFALAAIFDPTFVSLVVIAGRAELFWPVVAAHSTWTLVSHTPLVFVLALVVSGDHERVVGWFQAWRARISPSVVRVVTSVVFTCRHVLTARCRMVVRNGRVLITGLRRRPTLLQAGVKPQGYILADVSPASAQWPGLPHHLTPSERDTGQHAASRRSQRLGCADSASLCDA